MHAIPAASVRQDLGRLAAMDLDPAKRFLVVTVLADARLPFSLESIHPLVAYWQHRFEDYVEFFFPGYSPLPVDSPFSAEQILASFSEQQLTEAIETLQNESPWQYTGEATVLICTATVDEASLHDSGTRARLVPDHESVIEFNLERAIEEGAMTSVPTFFESILRFAREAPVIERLRSHLGLVSMGTVIVDSICESMESVSVADIRQSVSLIRFFRVRGLRRNTSKLRAG